MAGIWVESSALNKFCLKIINTTVTKIYTLHILCTSPVRLYRDIFAETNVYSKYQSWPPIIPISISYSSVADSRRNRRKYVILGSAKE